MSHSIRLHVQNGHIAGEHAWIYCWLHPHDSKVMYVGATWMHPAARAELHLHGADPKARIVGQHLASAGIDLHAPMEIVAFPVPSDLDRQTAKLALITCLAHEQLLSTDYFGPEPAIAEQAGQEAVAAWAATVIVALQKSQP